MDFIDRILGRLLRLYLIRWVKEWWGRTRAAVRAVGERGAGPEAEWVPRKAEPPVGATEKERGKITNDRVWRI